jgi:hypothetical protein
MSKLNLRKTIQTVIAEEQEILGQTKLIPLSQINKLAAKAAIALGGKKDDNEQDDVVAGSEVTVPVNKMRASQKEIRKDKAFGMAIGFLTKNKWSNINLQSIISNDTPAYIMDGHHRWAAVFLIDPKASIIATKLELPGEALVSVLNVVTVGGFQRAGNTGQGDVKEFTGSKLKPIIDAAIAKGIQGEFPVTAEQVKKALGNMPGANGDFTKGIELMLKNADSLPKQIMPNAPSRVEMPVIGLAQVKKVKEFLARGSFDIKPPYSPDVQAALGKNTVKVNELRLTSYGVKDLLKAIFNRLDLLPKLGFDKFKHVIHHLKYGDQEEQNDLVKRLKELGVNVVYESKEDKLRKLVREEVAKIIKGKKQTK